MGARLQSLGAIKFWVAQVGLSIKNFDSPKHFGETERNNGGQKTLYPNEVIKGVI